jgi:hypothetical protein
MRLVVATAIALSIVGPALAAWVDADVADIRIDLDPAYAAGKEVSKGVRKNDDAPGTQSDRLSFGKLAEPGPLAWLTFQTNSRPFKYEAPMDAIRTSIAAFKGAEISADGRSTYKAASVFGELDVIQFKVVLQGMARECATWRNMGRGNTVLVTGFVCSAKDQPLDAAEVVSAVGALRKLKD